MPNLTEDIRSDLTKIFSQTENVAEDNQQGTHILEMTIRCAFDGTLEEAQEKINDDFESFEAGENITDDWMPVDTKMYHNTTNNL